MSARNKHEKKKSRVTRPSLEELLNYPA